MGLYESNYRRLVRLIPERQFPLDTAISRSLLDGDLHLSIVSRERYTLTLRLTYWFQNGMEYHAQPDLTVRVYHDAALAEVLAPAGMREDYARTLAARWARNLLLNKWLAFLLGKGHGFVMAGRPRG